MSGKEKKGPQISRRQFLKDAGLIVGGATLGSVALVNACGGTTTVTAPGTTATKTITNTTTVAGPGGATVTTTVTAPGGGSTATVTATKTVTATSTAAPPTPTVALTNFTLNNKPYVLTNLKPNWTLAYVLREKLGFTGTKRGCDTGDCGVCTVIMENRPVLSCLVLAVEAEGKNITTIEGLAQGDKLDPLQQAFIDNDGMQCGFCTPGQIMTAKALLAYKAKPTLGEIKEYMAGTLCRCGSHPNIVAAIQAVAK